MGEAAKLAESAPPVIPTIMDTGDFEVKQTAARWLDEIGRAHV
jgi:hypothetical protein